VFNHSYDIIVFYLQNELIKAIAAVNPLYVHAGALSRSGTSIASNAFCSLEDCCYCKSYSSVDQSISNIMQLVESSLLHLAGEQRVREVDQKVEEALGKSKGLVEMVRAYFNEEPLIAELFRLRFIKELLAKWEKDALEECNQLSATGLYRLVHALDSFEAFVQSSVPVQIAEVSALILKHRRWMQLNQEVTSVDRFKKAARALLRKLPAPAIRAELELIGALKNYLRAQRPSDEIVQGLGLQAFSQGTDGWVPLRWRLLASPREPLLDTALRQSPDELYRAELLQEWLKRYLSAPKSRDLHDGSILELKSCALELKQVMPILNERLRKAKLTEVRLVASEVIHLDADLDGTLWASVHLVLKAPEIRINGSRRIDVSGRAAVVQDLEAATGPDGCGVDGHDGYAGQDGGHVTIVVKRVVNAGDLIIISNGGNGGRGQNGGRGLDGTDGRGMDLRRLRSTFDSHIKTKCNPVKHLEKMDLVNKNGGYLEVLESSTGLRMIFNYDRSRLMNTSTFFICIGTSGTVGKKGGVGGHGGDGGRPGLITAPSSIQIFAKKGTDGGSGSFGRHGLPGRNGWDIGYHDRAFWDKTVYYGLARNRRLNIVKHDEDGHHRSKCKHFESYIEISSELLPSPLQSYVYGMRLNQQATEEQKKVADITMTLTGAKTKQKTLQRSASTKRLLFRSKSVPDDESRVLSITKIQDVNVSQSDTSQSILQDAFKDASPKILDMNIFQRESFCKIIRVLNRSEFIVHCMQQVHVGESRLEMMKLMAAVIEEKQVTPTDYKSLLDDFKTSKSSLINAVSSAFQKMQAAIEKEFDLQKCYVESLRKKSALPLELEVYEDVRKYQQSLHILEDMLPNDTSSYSIIKFNTQYMNKSHEAFAKVAGSMPDKIWDAMHVETCKSDGLTGQNFEVVPDIVLCFGTGTELYCLLSTGNVCRVLYDVNRHSLVSKRYAESAIKGLLLGNLFQRESDQVYTKISIIRPYNFGLKCHCLMQDQNIVKKHYEHSSNIIVIDLLMKILSTKQFLPFSLLHIIAQGLHKMPRVLSSDELVFVLEYAVTSYTKNTCDLLLVQWILVAHPSPSWVEQLTLLHLESFLRMEIHSDSFLYNQICKVKRKDVLLLFNENLRDEIRNQMVDRLLVERIFELLGSTNKEAVDLAQLNLLEWPNVLRFASLRAELRSLLLDDDLDEAVSAFICIDTKFGTANAQQLLLRLKLEEFSSRAVCNLLSSIIAETTPINGALSVRSNEDDASFKQISEELKIFNCSILRVDQITLIIDELLNKLQGCEKTFDASTIKKSKTVLKSLRRDLQSGNDFILKALDMVDLKIEFLRGYRLRNTQKVAVLLILLNTKGTVLQVNTGEGKSLIVAAIAIIKVLSGKKVDIVTSSPVLAKRDAAAIQDLCAQFDITASHNCDGQLEHRREAYKNDIIYGDISGFQRDVLLDRFYSKDILGSRKRESIIIDEVDSMLLDKGNNTLYLSHEIAGLEKLRTIYVFIWNRINGALQPDTNLVDVAIKIKTELLNDIFGVIGEADIKKLDRSIKILQVKEILATLVSLKIIDNQGKLLVRVIDNDMTEKLHRRLGDEQKHLLPRIKFLIRSVLDRVSETCIPHFLDAFVEKHASKWIESALNALYMVENQDYVVDVDRAGSRLAPRVVILDRDTGTDLANSQWDEALHQFLQLKHGLHLTSQTLKAVFVSNASYLRSYASLCGLSGTLGSAREQQLLRELYDVECATLPPNRRRRLQLMEPRLHRSRDAWVADIKQEVKRMLQMKRSVLIICDTLEDVKNLNEQLDGENQDKVLTYTRDYEEFAFNTSKLPSGIVIISTNLAGRGTDLELEDSLSNNGGLHVIVSYLPPNDRVEQQALGRAARSGAQGSGRIICYTENSAKTNYHALVLRRGLGEIRRISEIKSFYEMQIQLEEECLEMFHDVYCKIRSKDCKDIFSQLVSSTASTLSNTGVLEKVFVASEKQKTVIKTEVYDVLERQLLDDWAFWLDSKAQAVAECKSEGDRSKIVAELKGYLQLAVEKSWKELIIHNPWSCVRFIKLLAQNGASTLAFQLCHDVIQREPNFSYSARYYLSFLALAPNACLDENLIKQLEDHLIAAKDLIGQEKQFIDVSTLQVSQQKRETTGLAGLSAFEEQQCQIKSIYDAFMGSIQQIIGRPISNMDFIPKNEKQPYNVNLVPQLIKSLLDAKIIEPEMITKNIDHSAIDRISFERGVPAQRLREVLESLKLREFSHKELIDTFRSDLQMPGRELFWQCLQGGGLLSNEKEILTVARAELLSLDPDAANRIEEKLSQGNTSLNVASLHAGNGRHLLQLFDWKEDPDLVHFESKALEVLVGAEMIELLEIGGHLMHNKVAEIDIKALKMFSFPCFDSFSTGHLKAAHIDDNDIAAVVKLLENNSVMKLEGSVWKLSIHSKNIEEISFVDIPVYKFAIISTLELCFAFRIAAEKIYDFFADEGTTCCVPLPHGLEETLFKALMEANQIKPRQVTKKPLSSKKIGQAIGKLFKGKNLDDIVLVIQDTLSNCQSSFVREKKIFPAIKCVAEYLPHDRDFEVLVQFETNNEADLIEWGQQLHQGKMINRILDMEVLISLGKVMYVSQKLMEKISDDKSSNAKHDELFKVKITDKFDALFDSNLIVLVNKVAFVFRFLLQWFFPRSYLVTKYSFGALQSGFGHALDYITKLYEQRSLAEKSQYVDLVRLGAYEGNVRSKVSTLQFNLHQNSAFKLIDHHLDKLINYLAEALLTASRDAVRGLKINSVQRSDEWLEQEVEPSVQQLLERVTDDLRLQLGINMSARRHKRSWITTEGIEDLFGWPDKERFMARAFSLFDRLIKKLQKQHKSIVDIDEDEDWVAGLESRVHALFVSCVKIPLNEHERPKLRDAAMKALSTCSLENLPLRQEESRDIKSPLTTVRKRVAMGRCRFESSVRALLNDTRDPLILALAIREDVPLDSDLLLVLFPLIEEFLQQLLSDVLVALCERSSGPIAGANNIFVDLSPGQMLPFVCGNKAVKSLYSEIANQIEVQSSTDNFRALFVTLLESELYERCQEVLQLQWQTSSLPDGSKLGPRKTETLLQDISGHLDAVYQVLRGRCKGIDVDEQKRHKVIEYLRGFKPEHLEVAFELALHEGTRSLQKILAAINVTKSEVELREKLEDALESTRFDLLFVELKLEGVQPGIFSVEKGVRIYIYPGNKEVQLLLKLTAFGDNVEYRIDETEGNNVNDLFGHLELNRPEHITGIGQLPRAARDLLPALGSVDINKDRIMQPRTIQPVVLPPVIQQKRSGIFALDFYNDCDDC
jgi:preprotein translocase subunit SecA